MKVAKRKLVKEVLGQSGNDKEYKNQYIDSTIRKGVDFIKKIEKIFGVELDQDTIKEFEIFLKLYLNDKKIFTKTTDLDKLIYDENIIVSGFPDESKYDLEELMIEVSKKSKNTEFMNMKFEGILLDLLNGYLIEIELPKDKIILAHINYSKQIEIFRKLEKRIKSIESILMEVDKMLRKRISMDAIACCIEKKIKEKKLKKLIESRPSTSLLDKMSTYLMDEFLKYYLDNEIKVIKEGTYFKKGFSSIYPSINRRRDYKFEEVVKLISDMKNSEYSKTYQSLSKLFNLSPRTDFDEIIKNFEKGDSLGNLNRHLEKIKRIESSLIKTDNAREKTMREILNLSSTKKIFEDKDKLPPVFEINRHETKIFSNIRKQQKEIILKKRLGLKSEKEIEALKFLFNLLNGQLTIDGENLKCLFMRGENLLRLIQLIEIKESKLYKIKNHDISSIINNNNSTFIKSKPVLEQRKMDITHMCINAREKGIGNEFNEVLEKLIEYLLDMKSDIQKG